MIVLYNVTDLFPLAEALAEGKIMESAQMCGVISCVSVLLCDWLVEAH